MGRFRKSGGRFRWQTTGKDHRYVHGSHLLRYLCTIIVLRRFSCVPVYENIESKDYKKYIVVHFISLLDLSSTISINNNDKIQSISIILSTVSDLCCSSQATNSSYSIKTNYFELSTGTVEGRLLVIL